jgi:hypothetical protein
VKFLRATRQTQKDQHNRSTTGEAQTTDIFTDSPTLSASIHGHSKVESRVAR